MIGSETEKDSDWQKTPYANLIRNNSSGKYFARLRVRGKLIRRSLKTKSLAVAKLRLSDLEKGERQKAEHRTAVAEGNMTFGAALAIYRHLLQGNAALKPRSKVFSLDFRVPVGLQTKRGTRKHLLAVCVPNQPPAQPKEK